MKKATQKGILWKGIKRYFLKEKRSILLITFFSFSAMIVSFIEPQFMSKMLTSIQNIVKGETKTLYIAIINAIAVFVIGTLGALIDNVRMHNVNTTSIKISRRIKMELAQKLVQATPKSVEQYSTEELTERMSESNGFTQEIFNLYNHIWSIIIGILVLIYTAFLSIPIFLLFIIGFIVILCIQKSAINKQKEVKSKRKDAQSFTRELIKQFIEAFADVKIGILGVGLKKHYKQALEEENLSILEESDTILNNVKLINIIEKIILLSFLVVSAILVFYNTLNVGEVIALFMYQNYIYSMVQAVTNLSRGYSEVSVSAERMNEILNYSKRLEEEKFGNKKIPMDLLDGNVRVNNVSVTIEEKPILEDVSLEIPANSFIGIVGESGCGKSTLLKVISKEIIPDEGEIYIDGIEINEFQPYSLRQAVSMVRQQPYIFSGMTIRENLMLANPDVSEERIGSVIKALDASFIEEKGLDTVIDTNQLSGGQKQKLALARFMLQKSKVILLDEATSALDNVSQTEIVKMIHQAKNDHTIVMVAHRLSTVKDANMIIFMEHGRISDVGSFEELYLKNEKFKRLVDS